MNANNHLSTEQPTYSDEIDLVALCATIWDGKWKIVGAALICLVLGVIYLLVAPKVYKLEVVLAPPMAADLEPIQPPKVDEHYTLVVISSDDAYGLVKGYLRSEEKRLSFWNQYFGVDSEAALSAGSLDEFLSFNEELVVKEGKKEDVSITLALMTKAPSDDVQMLKGFLGAINKQVIDELVGRMGMFLALQKGKLVEDIARTREQYRVQLQDQIVNLKEALTIAEKIGIKETPYQQLANVEVKVVDKDFLLGTKTLNSQLEALESRKGKDSFVPDLRKLQNQLQLVEADLATMQARSNKAHTFRVLKPLSRPLKEDSPKKALVLALSVVVGGFLGLFWIFISSLVDAVRQREAEAN